MPQALPDNSQTLKGLGVFAGENKLYLYYNLVRNNQTVFQLTSSTNGLEIGDYHAIPEIKDNQRRPIDTGKCSDFRISSHDGTYYLTYKYHGKQPAIYAAVSKDLISWRRIGQLAPISQTAMIAPNVTVNGKHILYFGEQSIQVAFSSDLLTWEVHPEPVLKPMTDHYGTIPLKLASVIPTHNSIIVLYYGRGLSDKGKTFSLHAAVFDKQNPAKLIWKSETIWEQTDSWATKNITPIGVVSFYGKLLSYWSDPEEGIFVIPHATLQHVVKSEKSFPHLLLSRIKENPLLKPIMEHFWESKATFNPAAVYMDGKVHLVYRAIGDDDTSVLGYATSSDGTTIDERHDEPIYVPSAPFESPGQISYHAARKYMSGGGYGGVEDPRLTKIGDKIHMTYVAFDGANPPRVALTSIHVKDFRERKWDWQPPVLISPPNVVDKNAVIFPEKVGGKYVILHRIFPNILLDFVDNLDFDGSTFLKGEYRISPSRTSWDSRKVGAGAPPIKTDHGWLLIYHAVGDQDPSRYKMGAMLLDLKDPTKVICRSRRPILAPDAHYENEGYKAGVAYPGGSVIVGNTLFIYYGGADTVVCAAQAPVDTFMKGLMESGTANLKPVHLS